ncbi:UvrD-helicase domain-containing protein [Tessaracoccus sp. HDW20]|nr:UvrD-helicase domain-containing protein [Tessaracoccus coleopterorum]
MVEFADQLREAVRLVTEVPAVGVELRQRFSVVLLDEYQDTSAAQARLLRELFTGPRLPMRWVFPSPRSATRTRPSTGGAGQQPRTSSSSPTTSDEATAHPPSGRPSASTGAAGSGSSTSVTSWPRAPGGPGEKGSPWWRRPGTARVPGGRRVRHLPRRGRLARRVHRRPARGGVGWADQAVLVRRNALLAPCSRRCATVTCPSRSWAWEACSDCRRSRPSCRPCGYWTTWPPTRMWPRF